MIIQSGRLTGHGKKHREAGVCDLMNGRTADSIALGQLPIPVMRGSRSQKSPYLEKVSDLAEYLDKQYRASQDDWEIFQK